VRRPEQIVDFAIEEKAELIIMASHGRSGFSRWAMGSVAEKVFHGSSVRFTGKSQSGRERITRDCCRFLSIWAGKFMALATLQCQPIVDTGLRGKE